MRLRDRLSVVSHPQVMAIVNITPDSFFDASRTWDEQSIAARVKRVVAEGATIIDIGGYSSRPGADEVTLDEELSEPLPLLRMWLLML